MDNTKRTKEAKERALVKIENNIENLYNNPAVQERLQDVRKNFNIYDGLYDRYEKRFHKIRSIQKLTEFLKEKWIDQNFEDKKVTEIINTHQTIYNISEELTLLKDKIAASEAKKNLLEIKIESEKYLKDMVNNYINGVNPIYWRMKINQNIWKSIMGAMLFNIPKEKTIALKESILKDYMPTIDKYLRIQINELTKMGDLEYIKPQIKRMQKRYKNQHNNINKKRSNKKDIQ